MFINIIVTTGLLTTATVHYSLCSILLIYSKSKPPQIYITIYLSSTMQKTSVDCLLSVRVRIRAGQWLRHWNSALRNSELEPLTLQRYVAHFALWPVQRTTDCRINSADKQLSWRPTAEKRVPCDQNRLVFPCTSTTNYCRKVSLEFLAVRTLNPPYAIMTAMIKRTKYEASEGVHAMTSPGYK